MEENLSIHEEIYTHEYLWRTAQLMLKEAKSNKEKPLYFILSALLHSYMAFEAFINFSGHVLFPELWADEKKYFKGKGGGIEAKILKLQEKLPDFQWVKGERPYQTIRKLQDFRDPVAHGKVVISHYDTIWKEDGTHVQWRHPWTPFISIEKAEQSMEAIKSFCESLLASMRKCSDHPHLAFSAFEGSLGSASGRSRARSN
jgi:hypothetical protein